MADLRGFASRRANVTRLIPRFAAIARIVPLAAALSFSSVATADEIRIVTGGDAFASEGDSGFVLIGNDFRFSGETPPGITTALGQCVIFLCSTGDHVNLSAHATPHLFDPEPATFEDRHFDTVFLQGDLQFHARTIAVPVVNGFAEISAPFSFTGSLSGFETPTFGGEPLFSTRLRGRGTVTLSFTNNAEFGTFADRVSYRFQNAAATPEPGTMMLLGSGIAGLMARRRTTLTFTRRAMSRPD